MKRTIDVSNDPRVIAFNIVDELERRFNAMSYEEKLAFAQRNPDLVKVG